MAGALRPVVILMLVASALFVVAGLLDGVYPGGSAWGADLAAVSYLFALVNTLVAILVARGSERSLALRMGLSIFFVVERPASAFLIGAKSAPSIGVHLATALVEAVILVSAVRVWRLGHSVVAQDLDQLLAIDAATMAPAPDGEEPAVTPGGISSRSSWAIAVATLLLASLLVADGLMAGFVPGGREWGLSGDQSGWLAYLYAVVALTVATRAVHGGAMALRLLTLVALILFVERAFTPFALRIGDPIALALHVLAAFVALALALVCAATLRAGAKAAADAATLEAA